MSEKQRRNAQINSSCNTPPRTKLQLMHSHQIPEELMLLPGESLGEHICNHPCSGEERDLDSLYPPVTTSLMKWYMILMCFVHLWNLGSCSVLWHPGYLRKPRQERPGASPALGRRWSATLPPWQPLSWPCTPLLWMIERRRAVWRRPRRCRHLLE